MIDDPIVQELRRIRKKIEDESHGDAEMYYLRIKESQEKVRERLVRRKPKMIESLSVDV